MKSNKIILAVLFCSVLGLILYSRSFFIDELLTIETGVLEVRNENVRQLSRVIECQAKINKVPWLVSRLRSTPNAEKKAYIEGQILSQIKEIDQVYFYDFNYPDEDLPLYDYLRQNWEGYKQLVFQVIASDKSDNYDEAQRQTENSLLYLERVNGGMKLIVSFHERDVAEKTDSIVQTAQLSKYNASLFTIGSTTVFLVIGLLAFRKIVSAETKLQEQVVEMADKNRQLTEQAEEINKLAFHDTLTGLPNRHYFQKALVEELETIEADTGYGAVVFLDMDNFKLVNDTYGHDVGDEFLIIIADRIRSLQDKEIFGARFGGDEFVLFLRGYDEHRTRPLLSYLLILIAMPVKIGDIALSPTSSIGVAFYPHQGNSVVDLLKKADIALYQAKSKKNSYAVYDNKALEEVKTRQRLEHSLKSAIVRNELCVVYQPIIDAYSQELIGLEALMRWDSEEHGAVPPSIFIPLAESTGMITPMGKWAIDEAAIMAKALQDLDFNNVCIAVNVSVIQLTQDDFIKTIEQAVKEHGIPAGSIKIELTETVLIESFEQIKDKIDQIRAMGVKICLDDFGTGYSSINYLTKLPLDVLKLDKSLLVGLVNDAKSQKVLENLICMAHGIGIQVVAEGVETRQQMELVQYLGCNYVQGYYISRPMTKAMLIEQLVSDTSPLQKVNSACMFYI